MRFVFENAARRRNRKLLRGISSEQRKKSLLKTTVSLITIAAAHTGAMMAFEKLSFGDSLWLTVTSLSTVGYGDISAKTTLGQFATGGLIFMVGVAVLAQAASQYFDYRQIKSEKLLNGKWKWKMKDHIVFLNSPEQNADRYFKRMMTEMRGSSLEKAKLEALIVSSNIESGLSDELKQMDVAAVNYNAHTDDAFENSNLSEAGYIVVMCENEDSADSDSVTLDLVTRAREANPNAVIIAEVVQDKYKSRVKNAGANHIIRPIRQYPEMLVRTILAPGTEQVVEDLFDSEGEECVRYNFTYAGPWGHVALAALLENIGNPIAYMNKEGEVVSNIHADDEVNLQALFVVSCSDSLADQNRVNKVFAPGRMANIAQIAQSYQTLAK